MLCTGLRINGRPAPLTKARLITFAAEVDNGQSGGGSVTIDWNAGQKQRLSLTGNPTVSFSDPPGPGNFVLHLLQDATGGRSITWPASLRWAGGQAPTLTATGNGEDIVALYFDGSSYYAVASLDF